MTTLIFLITVFTLFILTVSLLIKMIRRKSPVKTLLIISAIVLIYGVTWAVCNLTRKQVPVPLGTEVCFDDWCATVSKSVTNVTGDSIQVLLTISMSNHARGIVQKPSEPRVHVLDASGHAWSYSSVSQQAYEQKYGAQPGIGHRLELHQSLKTVLVFMLPKRATGLQALIEEGPWITNLLFPEDQQVFPVKNF